MSGVDSFFWSDICIWVGGVIRFLVLKPHDHKLAEYVNHDDQMRMNLLIGNLILIPILVVIMLGVL